MPVHFADRSEESKTESSLGDSRRQRCLLFALLCASIGLLWQTATVYRNYQGNWTALFCIGALNPVPDLPGENMYRFPHSYGFDGQYYYVIAHDPSPTSAIASKIDSPELRYQRILVPLLAYIVSLGNPQFIAAAFVAINVYFLFLGSWWMAKMLALQGANPAWGLAFLLVPAVPVSLDRMTVDLVLVALAAGAFYFFQTGQQWKMAVALGLMCLTRDTGVVVAVAFVAIFLIRRQWKQALVAMAAMLPAGLWLLYVAAVLPLAVGSWGFDHPFRGTWDFLAHAPAYPFAPPIALVLRVLDLAALAGLAFAIVTAVLDATRNPLTPMRASNVLIGALGVHLMSLDDWTHVYDYGRVLSPLTMNLMISGIASGRWWMLLPAGSMTLRVAAQLAPQALGLVSPR